MFKTIFRYELKYWAKQPSIYLYFVIFFFAGFMAMGDFANIWEDHRHLKTSVWMANAPHHINGAFNILQKLILLLLPTVIGMSVYRDFRSNTHLILYAYPFQKPAYLLAKFLSSYLVLCLTICGVGLGMYVVTQLPAANQAMLMPFDWWAYAQPYLLYVFPNILFLGTIIFAIVLLTRNIYAGFVGAIVLLFFQGGIPAILGGMDNEFLASILEPFGKWASGFYTKYWTVAEYNAQLLPVRDVLIYNRLLWLGIAALVFTFAYRKFNFSQNAPDLFFFKNEPEAKFSKKIPQTFGSITKVNLPKVRFDFSFQQQLKATWQLSNMEFKYIIKNPMFVCILIAGFSFVLFQQLQMNPQFGYDILPVTWYLLQIPSMIFGGVVMLLTFLFAGMLVHRSRLARMNQLVDMSPVANWTLLLSKFIALVKMQAFLLSFIILGGLITQISKGFYDFNFGLYFFDIYGLTLISFVLWAFVALFIQTIFNNPFLGTILLLLGSLGIAGLPELGFDHLVFQYNVSPRPEYSDMDGFGKTLAPFFLYKTYWMLFGGFLFLGTYCWWTRGLPHSFLERFKIALIRMNGKPGLAMAVLLVSFLAFGFKIYTNDTINGAREKSNDDQDKWMVEAEKRYKKYEKTPQPRIHANTVNIDIFPEKREYRAVGTYIAVNESAAPMDTILVHYNFNERIDYELGQAAKSVLKDSIYRFDIWILDEPLAVGDSLFLKYDIQNRKNTTFDYNSRIKGNGTYFTNQVFPGFGYQGFELTDNNKRKKYGLPKRNNAKALPTDSTALYNNYGSKDTDWIHLEAVMSAPKDQIAIAPGYLQREWEDNGRKYFHYKMEDNVKDYYGFNCGKFAVIRDKWEDIDLEIYYHKDHDYVLERMMQGMKSSLEFNSKNFAPYQHQQARIIEFPISYGTFATTFANSVPFSEVRFISTVDDDNPESIDMPLYVAAHEIAHQWWGNQLTPADVLGARMLTESMAEYSALKVLEKEYGTAKMQYFLTHDMEAYLRSRGKDNRKEHTLLCSHPSQDFVNYRKGALVMYALSDYIGEDNFHAAVRKYLEKVRFQSAPYTTSYEMLDYLREATPDSLKYLITDMFETITLYENRVENVKITPLDNGKYQVDLDFLISKYRSDGRGVRSYTGEGGDSLTFKNERMLAPLQSLPLADYIEIGIYGQEEIDGKTQPKELYLKKHKVTQIDNKISVIVDEKPYEVGVDPSAKLIDAERWDNRRKL